MVDEPSDTAIKVKVSTWQKLNSKKLPGQTFDDVITELIIEYKKRLKGE